MTRPEELFESIAGEGDEVFPERTMSNDDPNTAVKGAWQPEEDAKVVELVSKLGAKKWSTIASHLPGRIGKQCRERCAARVRRFACLCSPVEGAAL